MSEPKNIHIALVKIEDIQKDKDKRIIKRTSNLDFAMDTVNQYIFNEEREEIFLVKEVRTKKTIKKDGMFKSEYWEIDYSGEVGLSKGKDRRVYQIVSMPYEILRRYRLKFLQLVDEFEEWGIIKRKK